MKLFRMKTLGVLGIGFLAGSRAGRGPWEKAQESMGQLKGKVGGSSSMGSTSSGPLTTSNGMDSSQKGTQKGNQSTPALTEM